MYSNGPNPGVFAPSTPKCSQCGFYHPPVSGKCDLAPIETVDGKKVELDKFISNFRVLLSVLISDKKIKNPEDFFKYISLSLNDLVNKYEEK